MPKNVGRYYHQAERWLKLKEIFVIPFTMLIISVYTDIKYRKIKNHITYPMIISGLLAGYFYNGLGGLADSFTGMLTAGLIFTVVPGFFSGGGDIKLAAGCGAWLGSFYPTLQFVFFSMLFVFIGIIFLTSLKKGPGFLLKRLIDEIRELTVACLTMDIKKLTRGGYQDFPEESVYVPVPMAPYMLAAYSIILLMN
jgi:Flp pilus assembly protein protease CpaA